MSMAVDNRDHEKTNRQPSGTSQQSFPLQGGEKREWGGLAPNKGGSATNGEARNDWSIFRPTRAHAPTPQWVVSKT